jgi:hypothetical protein
MAASRHKLLAVLKRREHVADLYLKGWTQVAIAAECGVAQSRISVDLAKIREAWLNSAIRDFNVLRERELQRIDRVEREAWAAWERSQQPAQSAVVTGEDITKRTKKSVHQKYGDPRFLDIVHKCIAQRRAMLGLDMVIVDAPPPEKLTPLEDLEKQRAETTAMNAIHERLRELGIRLGLGANALDPAQPPPGMFDEAGQKMEESDEMEDEPPPRKDLGGW